MFNMERLLQITNVENWHLYHFFVQFLLENSKLVVFNNETILY